MRQAIVYLTFGCFLLLLIPSCSIEKRRYTNGFHIERISKSKNADHRQNDAVAATEAQLPETADDPISLATAQTVAADTLALDTALTSPTTAAHTAATKPRKANKIAEHARTHLTKRIDLETTISSPESTVDAEKPSALAIVTMVVIALGLLVLLLAMTVFEGWAALGYVILGVMIIILGFLLGLLTLLIDTRKNKKIPIAFYILFVLAALISIWVLFGLLFSKLGWI